MLVKRKKCNKSLDKSIIYKYYDCNKKNRRGGMCMTTKIKEKSDIKYLSARLTEENKRYVIAVANALLFTQEKEQKKVTCDSSVRHVI